MLQAAVAPELLDAVPDPPRCSRGDLQHLVMRRNGGDVVKSSDCDYI
jgi:hypothetical protein